VYLSVCILIGDKYIFTVTVTFTTYIPVYIDGMCVDILFNTIRYDIMMFKFSMNLIDSRKIRNKQNKKEKDVLESRNKKVYNTECKEG